METNSRLLQIFSFIFRTTDTIRYRIESVSPQNGTLKKVVGTLFAGIGIFSILFILIGRQFLLCVVTTFLIAFIAIDYITALQTAAHSVRRFLIHFLLYNLLIAFGIGFGIEAITAVSSLAFLLVVYAAYFILSILASLVAEERVAKMGHTIISVLISMVGGFSSFVTALQSLNHLTSDSSAMVQNALKIIWFPLTLISVICAVLAGLKEYWRNKYDT